MSGNTDGLLSTHSMHRAHVLLKIKERHIENTNRCWRYDEPCVASYVQG